MVQASAKLAGTTLVSICHFRVLDDRSGWWPRASRRLGEIAFQHLTFNFAKSKNTEIMGEEVMVIWVQSHAAHRQHDE